MFRIAIPVKRFTLDIARSLLGFIAAVQKKSFKIRQIWKRSGAWFYKTLPRVQTASCPNSPCLPGASGKITSPMDLIEPVHEPMTDQETSVWVKFQPRRISSIADLGTGKQLFQRKIRHPINTSGPYPSSTLSSENLPTASLTDPTGGVAALSSPTTKASTCIQQQRKIIGSENVANNEQSRKESDDTADWGAPSHGIITSLPYHPAFATQKVIPSGTVSSLGNPNTSKKVASLTGEQPVLSLEIMNKPPPERRGTRVSTDDAPFGMLYFTLYHDTINKQLHVAIHKAKSALEGYIQVLFLSRLAVLDEDLYGSDWLGEYWLPLSRLTSDRLTDFSVPLGPKKPLHRGELDLACPTRGKIQLGLRYLEDKKQLCVEVIRCADLASMDPNGFSDPFVKL
ncbi:uncharacterized protein DEA37_0011618 [Paragonimus westermani]|uniref:C2 domain-containing protein n=1 Tax=Paragonimus westermani TaxID=34504 RepID=A0A5J4NMN0_9TREM|nr:uncharacterized protein DEA37_0011618 [Paragonimus westermani]